MATIADLQSQYQQLKAKADYNGSLGGGFFDRDLQNRMEALSNQINQQSVNEGAASAKAKADKDAADLAGTKQKILDYSSGRGDAMMNDAMTNAALGRLNDVSAGNDAPFTQTVQNQMLSQQAGMNATAAGSQAEQLRMQAAGLGGSTADPSYQAKLRQISSNQQSSNANAQGQIASTAQLQNFGARQQATTSLLSGRMGQMGMANGQYNLGAGYLNQTTQDSAHQSAVQPVVYNFGGGQQPMNYNTPNIVYQQNRAPAAAAAPVQQQQAPTQPRLGDYSNSTTPSYRLQGPRPPDMNNAAYLASLGVQYTP